MRADQILRSQFSRDHPVVCSYVVHHGIGIFFVLFFFSNYLRGANMVVVILVTVGGREEAGCVYVSV